MPPRQAPTHKVTALRTLAFPGSSIKLPPVSMPPLGARVAVVREQERFAIAPFGFIPLNHLAPLQVYESDFVAVAQRFVGTPYLWGGKTNQGIDCSGLVQIALTACGVACPRDSDMQERALGDVVVPNDDLSDLQRGDLLFWPGHVAIVTRAQMLLHANAFHMAVMAEPLAQAIQRIAASGIPLRAIKRLAQSHGGQR
jgi:cell wall-associated NlpC family hydrolase